MPAQPPQSDHCSDAPPSAAANGEALRACYNDNFGGPYQDQHAFAIRTSDADLPNVEIAGEGKIKSNVRYRPHPPSKHVQTPDERLKSVAHKNGLNIKAKNGRFEYHQSVNGKDQVAFTTDRSEADANRQIHGLVGKREAELTAKYGVRFAKAGETASFNDVLGNLKTGECCDPTLKELEGVDAALSKNRYTPDGNAGPPCPKLYFLKDNVCPGLAAIYSQDQSSMFVMPTVAELNRATNKGASPKDCTIEGEFNHELNHWAHDWEDRFKAAERRPGIVHRLVSEVLKRVSNSAEPVTEPTDTEKARYQRLGWKELDTAYGYKEWVIQGKDQHYYTCVESDNGQDVWVRVDQQGAPIDPKGKKIAGLTDDGDAARRTILKSGVVLDDKQMKRIMNIKPLTDYYTTPEEELSESESFFHSEVNRRFLARDDWPLYLESKQLDQERINEANGVGQGGQPLYIRGPDGKIVPNDQAHRAEVSSFEEEARQSI